MARPRSKDRDTFIDRATHVFWRKGYDATSIGDLVEHTRVGRGAIYSDYGGKRDLFLACLAYYETIAVTPAFARVEADGARLEAIELFMDQQISALIEAGLPARGCLIGNTLTEAASRDPDIAEAVRALYERLIRGFTKALQTEARLRGMSSGFDAKGHAALLAIAFQGLLAYARCCTQVEDIQLRAASLKTLAGAPLR